MLLPRATASALFHFSSGTNPSEHAREMARTYPLALTRELELSLLYKRRSPRIARLLDRSSL